MSIVSGTVGAVMASNAQGKATRQNKENAEASLAMQERLYNEDVARNKPFYNEGVKALPQLQEMVNGNYNMQESPAAKYQLTQGTRSLNRQLAARGLLGSGNAAQRLSELSTGVAANDYDKQYSRLLDQVKIGTGASGAAGASSQTFGNQIGQNSQQVQQNNTQGGQARASLYSGMGGASAGAANIGLNAYRSGLFSGAETGAAFNGTMGSGGFGTSAAVADGSTWTAADVAAAL